MQQAYNLINNLLGVYFTAFRKMYMYFYTAQTHYESYKQNFVGVKCLSFLLTASQL